MRTILVLFLIPAAIGILAGLLIRWLSRKYGWTRGWLIFAMSLCYATLDTGAIWYAAVGDRSNGWAELGALITGAILFSFSLAGVLAAGVRRASLGPWAPPASRLWGALRGFLGYGLGTLLLSPVILLLGTMVSFSASPGQPGLPLPAYLLILAAAYLLLGLLLGRWLAQDSPISAWGVLVWVVLLVGLGLLAVGPDGAQSRLWWPLYGRLNFPAAVCLGDYQFAMPAPAPWLTLVLSAAPPVLFGLGWLAARLLRRSSVPE